MRDGGLWFRSVPGFIVNSMGCLMGVLPTAWTLVVPVLLLGYLIANAKRTADLVNAEPRAAQE